MRYTGTTLLTALADKLPADCVERASHDRGMRHGVSWFDDHARFEIVIPHIDDYDL